MAVVQCFGGYIYGGFSNANDRQKIFLLSFVAAFALVSVLRADLADILEIDLTIDSYLTAFLE